MKIHRILKILTVDDEYPQVVDEEDGDESWNLHHDLHLHLHLQGQLEPSYIWVLTCAGLQFLHPISVSAVPSITGTYYYHTGTGSKTYLTIQHW